MPISHCPSQRRRSAGRRRLAGQTLVAAAVMAGTVVFGAPSLAGATPASGAKVIVLSAGSLVTIMKTAVEPGFHRATGDRVTDISGGSTGLAQDVKTGVHRADVFWSASPTADQKLMGASNGNWVSWYVEFATSELVLGYNPNSRFASTIETEPWWKVITKPGFRLGRTNPVTDPKGRLAVTALKEAAAEFHDPAVGAIVSKQTTVFTETSLVGRLQSGQLDAGFFYAVEASAAHFPTVPLTGVSEHASYTLTVLAKAPDPAVADSFISWILSSPARKLLAAHGLNELSKPELFGNKNAVPLSLRKVIG